MTDINFLREIKSGYLSISHGGKPVYASTLNFSSVRNFADVATEINTKLGLSTVKVTADETGKRLILSDESKEIGYAFDNGGKEIYVGRMLGLEDGGATIIKAQEVATVKAESTIAALSAISNLAQSFYGVYVCGQPTDAEVDSAHSWVSSASLSKVLAYTAIRDEQIEWEENNIIKKWHDINSGRVMVQYNRTGDNHAGAALLAEAVSTNWQGSNTAKTIKFKMQATRSDSGIAINEANKCTRLGVNFYTDYDGISLLAEGAMVGGRFIDEVMGLDAFIDAIQKAAFNYIHSVPKVPQTDKGTEAIISQLVPVGNEFARNGFIAGGTWNGAPVGELNTGDYLDTGYYFYADSFDEQSQTVREMRQGMPISVAIKLAGAIHKQDIIVSFNR